MATKRKGKLHVGTSNIVLPGNKQSFPLAFRDKSRLHYYSSLFNSVEINSSFYKIPLRTTFEKWSQDVSASFTFTLKLWREITHVKNLDFDPAHVERFMAAANGIGVKKGCLLIQLPGKISLDYFTALEKLLEGLQQSDPKKQWRLAIEFRSANWHVGETYELLNQYKAAVVLHDHPKAKISEVVTDASFVYCRFHGPNGNYRERYTDSYLTSQFQQMQQWLKAGKDVYAYFNNTIGDAFENAMYLQSLAGAL